MIVRRGLRLCVNQQGERLRGFEINTLTVIATESYEQFAEKLQKDYEDAGIDFGVVTRLRTGLGEEIALPNAFVLGNEVDGVEESALALCDGTIEIPQFGTKHSLNVAVAAGIVVWEVVRKMKGFF